MPDVYVPLDTTALTPLYKKIQDKDLVSRFVYNNLIVSPPSFAVGNFIADYQITGQLFQQFLNYVRNHDVAINAAELRPCRAQLEQDIKSLVGRYFFGSDAWFKVRNEYDYTIQRSLEALN